MYHMPIAEKEPIRLFKSDFLEFFTHISPVTIVVVWLPVALYFLIRAAVDLPAGSDWVFIPLCFLGGMIIWTFSEYMLHRFLFHYIPKSKKVERIIFLFHGINHVQPQVKTRLVMPLPVSVPLAALFYGFFWLVFARLLNAPAWVGPFFSGFIIGYLIYDLMHYAEHHFPMRSGYAKFIKRYHMQHHYKTPNARFGVSVPLWDYVFGTAIKEDA